MRVVHATRAMRVVRVVRAVRAVRACCGAMSASIWVAQASCGKTLASEPSFPLSSHGLKSCLPTACKSLGHRESGG